jgi:hypothetical protein
MTTLEHFYHDDLTASQVHDAREKRTLTINSEDIFYIGFQVSVGNAMWYHHAVILANSVRSLLGGSVTLVEKIGQNLGFDAKIVPVFLRSLMAAENEVLDFTYQSDIAKEIEERLAAKLPGIFLVFGRVGENRFTLMELTDDDAMSAVYSAFTATQEQMGEAFFPINVCQSHPVTHEFAARFDAAVCRINALLSDCSTSSH